MLCQDFPGSYLPCEPCSLVGMQRDFPGIPYCGKDGAFALHGDVYKYYNQSWRRDNFESLIKLILKVQMFYIVLLYTLI